ncbi:putative GPI-anchored adhesin-like protein PGA55-like [Platysternon megacephalum]|uniref:Cyclin-A2 n=1 Tax=Platysternon megacephalum TaxID=55544 RepID=A0A4D9F7I1_9SAUR|nr:putative GPI-anchored adhesin-like protein PGA55-like [Platysternon megacephalum]
MMLTGAADSEQENQENVPPGGKARPPAAAPGARPVLALLRGNQRRPTQQQAALAHAPWSINDENYGKVPAGKAGNKQPAFAIHMDEPDGERRKRQVVPKKAVSHEEVLSLNTAVTSLGDRKPLAPIDNPMDLSFDSPSIMDISVTQEVEEKVNVNQVPDYIEDIYTYLREMEVKCKPKVGYMKKQPDITNNMRAILVDWLVEVGEEYKLQNETLHLAVNYIDRFLSSMSVLRGKLQLVGTAAMLLASKFEEIYPPEVAEFVYITDDTYTKKQVLRMEHLVLKVLSFDLAAPTINQFLTQYFLHQQTNVKVENLSMYLGELSLIDADPYLKYLPSLIAAAAFHLASYTITGQTLPESLSKMTGYTLESLKPCLMDLHKTYLRAAQHTQQSIREKYKSSKYHGVSLIDPPETLNLS